MNPLLTLSPSPSDGGHLIGRDPRELSADDFRDYLPNAPVGLAAIRAKCLECCCGNSAEVRKCTAATCPLWPLRMGVKPRGLREARGEKVDAPRGYAAQAQDDDMEVGA